MRYCKIKPNDVANGSGIVVSLWTQGCPHRCEGCHNPETWKYDGGKEFTGEEATYILKCLDADGISRNLSILGGEPLSYINRCGVFALCELIKEHRPETVIYLWTGYTIEELSKDEYIKKNLYLIDVLIDGRFEQDKKDLSLKYCGSTNQRVINIKDTIRQEKIILL